MKSAVGEEEFGGGAYVGAYFGEESFALEFGEETDAGSGEEEDGGVWYFFGGNLVESVSEELVEVVGADEVDGIGKGGDAWEVGVGLGLSIWHQSDT